VFICPECGREELSTSEQMLCHCIDGVSTFMDDRNLKKMAMERLERKVWHEMRDKNLIIDDASSFGSRIGNTFEIAFDVRKNSWLHIEEWNIDKSEVREVVNHSIGDEAVFFESSKLDDKREVRRVKVIPDESLSDKMTEIEEMIEDED